MLKFILLYVVLLLFSTHIVSSQKLQLKSKKLLFISGMPVKIDGDCSFFIEKSNSLYADNSQLTIDAIHRAFIELSPGNFVFFKKSKREKNLHNGYVDFFSNKKGSLILKIDTVEKSGEFKTIRKGTLTLKYPGATQTLQVHGRVQERDEYYYKLYHKK